MTHPITPPPEMVQKWLAEIWHEGTPVRVALSDEYIATRAAQWGADQELEACCADLRTIYGIQMSKWLRSMRRPKPPSLKEQALRRLDYVTAFGDDKDIIRRALESIND
jgi:hypothetical protein